MNPLYLKSPIHTLYKTFVCFVILVFTTNLILPFSQVFAQQVFSLPSVGTMITTSTNFTPLLLKGIKVDTDNPFKLNFIIDTGHAELDTEALKYQSTKLIKYFLASLTVPKEELWVNLSPYEKDRVIPDAFGITEMGRDLLAQDYILKQITASLIYPEHDIGKTFWDKIYQEVADKYGKSVDIPINTFNKVWIIPEKAVVYTQQNEAFVIESHMKVMLEEDYVALKNSVQFSSDILQNNKKSTDELSPQDLPLTTQIVREIILPAIEKEVNEGQHFSNLRQIYHSLILALWYKKNLQESLLGKIYVDQNKISGIDLEDKNIKNKIYNQYIEAFQKGVFDYIKEEYDPETQDVVNHKYISGGWEIPEEFKVEEVNDLAANAEIPTGNFKDLTVELSRVNNKSTSTTHDLAQIAQIDRTNAVDYQSYITYRHIFRTQKLEDQDAKPFITQPEQFKAIVEDNSRDLEPAKTDFLVTRQTGQIEQSILELIANASDATTDRSSPIGRFGMGAMQMLAFLLDEKYKNVSIDVNTKTANSIGRQLTFFRGDDGKIKLIVKESQKTKPGTSVTIRFPEGLDEALRQSIEEFLKTHLNLFTKMKINQNGKLINPLDDYIFLNGDKVHYDQPESTINVYLTDQKITVEDFGSGMSDDVILDKYLIPRLGENQDVEETISDEIVKEQVHLFYKGPASVTEETTCRIVFQISGINIQSREVTGFGLPQELIIQLPASTKLTVARDKIEIDKITELAIKIIAEKIAYSNPIHQIELMNGFMGAVRLLDEVNTRVDVPNPLIHTAKKIFTPFVLDQNRLVLPSNQLFRDIEALENPLFVDEELTYSLSAYQIPGAVELKDTFERGTFRKAYAVPFKEDSTVLFLTLGADLIINKDFYEKYKDLPLILNYVLNYHVGYGNKELPKGKFIIPKETAENQKKPIKSLMPILDEFPVLKGILSNKQKRWVDNYPSRTDEFKKLKIDATQEVTAVVSGPDGTPNQAMTQDSDTTSVPLHQIPPFAAKMDETKLRAYFQKLTEFIERVPEVIRAQVNWDEILPFEGTSNFLFNEAMNNPDQILLPNTEFLNAHRAYFLDPYRTSRIQAYLHSLLMMGKLKIFEDQETIHKLISLAYFYKIHEVIDEDLIKQLRESFGKKNLEDLEEAFAGIRDAIDHVELTGVKTLITQWLQLYNKDPSAAKTFVKLLRIKYPRDNQDQRPQTLPDFPGPFTSQNFNNPNHTQEFEFTGKQFNGKSISYRRSEAGIQLYFVEPNSNLPPIALSNGLLPINSIYHLHDGLGTYFFMGKLRNETSYSFFSINKNGELLKVEPQSEDLPDSDPNNSMTIIPTGQKDRNSNPIFIALDTLTGQGTYFFSIDYSKPAGQKFEKLATIDDVIYTRTEDDLNSITVIDAIHKTYISYHANGKTQFVTFDPLTNTIKKLGKQTFPIGKVLHSWKDNHGKTHILSLTNRAKPELTLTTMTYEGDNYIETSEIQFTATNFGIKPGDLFNVITLGSDGSKVILGIEEVPQGQPSEKATLHFFSLDIDSKVTQELGSFTPPTKLGSELANFSFDRRSRILSITTNDEHYNTQTHFYNLTEFLKTALATSDTNARSGFEALAKDDDLSGLPSLVKAIVLLLKNEGSIHEEKTDERDESWTKTNTISRPIPLALMNYLYEKYSKIIKTNPNISFTEFLKLVRTLRSHDIKDYTDIVRSTIKGLDKTQRAWIRETGVQNPRDAIRRARELGDLAPEAGEIQIRNFMEGDNWVFSVRDHGTGMTLSDLLKYFFPIDNSSKKVGIDSGNLGNGLYTIFADFDTVFVRTSTGNGIIQEFEIMKDQENNPVIVRWEELQGDYKGTEIRRIKNKGNSNPQLESLFIQEALERFAGAIQSPQNKMNNSQLPELRDVKITFNGATFSENIPLTATSKLKDNEKNELGDISIGRAVKSDHRRVIQDGILIKSPDEKELRFIPPWLQIAFERYGNLHIMVPRKIEPNIPRTGYSKESHFLHNLQVAVLHNMMKTILKDYIEMGAKIPGVTSSYFVDYNTPNSPSAKMVAELMHQERYDEITDEMLAPFIVSPDQLFKLFTQIIFDSNAYTGPMTLNEIRQDFIDRTQVLAREEANPVVKESKLKPNYTPKGQFARDIEYSVGQVEALAEGKIGGQLGVLAQGERAKAKPVSEVWQELPEGAELLFTYLSLRFLQPIVGKDMPKLLYYNREDGAGARGGGDSIFWNLAYKKNMIKQLYELSKDPVKLIAELQRKDDSSPVWQFLQTLVHESQHLSLFEKFSDHTHHDSEKINGYDVKKDNRFGVRMDRANGKIFTAFDEKSILEAFTQSPENMRDFVEQHTPQEEINPITKIITKIEKINMKNPAPTRDEAALAEDNQKVKTPGGIDLSPDLFNVDVKGDNKIFNVPENLNNGQMIEINGLIPIIINITPIPSLPLYLGLSETKETPQLSQL